MTERKITEYGGAQWQVSEVRAGCGAAEMGEQPVHAVAFRSVTGEETILTTSSVSIFEVSEETLLHLLERAKRRPFR